MPLVSLSNKTVTKMVGRGNRGANSRGAYGGNRGKFHAGGSRVRGSHVGNRGAMARGGRGSDRTGTPLERIDENGWQTVRKRQRQNTGGDAVKLGASAYVFGQR